MKMKMNETMRECYLILFCASQWCFDVTNYCILWHATTGNTKHWCWSLAVLNGTALHKVDDFKILKPDYLVIPTLHTQVPRVPGTPTFETSSAQSTHLTFHVMSSWIAPHRIPNQTPCRTSASESSDWIRSHSGNCKSSLWCYSLRQMLFSSPWLFDVSCTALLHGQSLWWVLCCHGLWNSKLSSIHCSPVFILWMKARFSASETYVVSVSCQPYQPPALMDKASIYMHVNYRRTCIEKGGIMSSCQRMK